MKGLFIDIGSNSIRCMIAERKNGSDIFYEKSIFTTRLAEGLIQTGRLSQERMEMSLQAIAGILSDPGYDGLPVYAYATSAVRDATNGKLFCERLARLGDLDIAVLDGVLEARYAYLAATNGHGGMIDIGGGSAQIIDRDHAVSYPLGCVRAKDLAPSQHLSEIQQMLRPHMERIFASRPPTVTNAWTGVGGSITTLGAICAGLSSYDKSIVQGFYMARSALYAALIRLDKLGDDERQKIPLLAKRKDVILHGGIILLYLLEWLGIDGLTVSDRDGLEGYAMWVFNRQEERP